MKVVFTIFALSFSLYISASEINYVVGSEVIISQLTAKKECIGDKEPQVFIVKGQTVNYQIPVPIGGDFQVHLIPGTYQIIAINDKGCIFEKEHTSKANKLTFIDIHLKEGPMEKTSLFDYVITPAKAMAMCLQCLNYPPGFGLPQYGNNFGGYPYLRYGHQTPYWGPFGHFSFNNFSSPCPMMGMPSGAYRLSRTGKKDKGRFPAGMGFAPSPNFLAGCNGGMYPGGGMAVAGKPVTYFYSDKKKLKVDLKLDLKHNGNILATSPIISKDGIQFEVSSDGGITKDDTKYPYLFYDIRMDLSNVQSEYGVCTHSRNILGVMTDFLEKLGFNEKEIKDFGGYWNVKLPEVNKVCVFPQVKNLQEHIVGLKITPKPSSTTRVIFMLVPIIEGKWPKTYFTKAPRKGLKSFKFEKTKSSNKGLVVREWGVGFLTVPEQNSVPNKISSFTLPTFSKQ